MIKFIDKNYYKLNMIYIFIIAFFCMAGLIVPLQFISGNKIVAAGVTFFGILLGTYNLIVKKIYLQAKNIEWLILFFIFNIITCSLVLKYGFTANLKNGLIFYLYFFTIYPIFKVVEKEKIKNIILLFFGSVTILNTLGVIVSLIQFLLLKGYRIEDYKGLVIRQGFVESRLFGILASPNYLSITSLIIIIFLVTQILKNKLTIFVKVLVYISIILNYIYIVLSGSRTTYICLLLATLVYFSLVYFNKKLKSLVKILLVLVIVFVSYTGVKIVSEKYLDWRQYEVINSERQASSVEALSLERTDTGEQNISNNRFAIWKSTLKFVPKRPVIGYSSGNWYNLAKDYDSEEYIVKVNYLTHNGYIEVLFYNGILGLITMGLFIFKFLFSAAKKSYSNISGKINYDIIMIISIVLVILTANLFLSSTLYGISLFGIILFLVIGYYYQLLENYDEYEEINIDEIKSIELKIMDYIDNISRKNNINYSLGYGTLLGAIRHKGFIPWDDDIDIMLLRNDYEKLYKLIEEDNNNNFKVISYKNNKQYPFPFFRVYDTRTFYVNNYLNSDLKLGLCVDVFPMDYYTDVDMKMVQYDKYRQLSAYSFYGIRTKKASIVNLVRYVGTIFFRIFGVKRWNKKMNDLSQSSKEGQYVDYLMEKKNNSTKLKIEYFSKYIDIEFEDRIYKSVEQYDKVLEVIYGSDYMEIPSKEKRISHAEFCAYKKCE